MCSLDFPVTEKYTKHDVKKVQIRLLEMAVSAIEILEHNGFNYLLAFGSLLGAVRHQGFIPWDDDFDIFLFDEEYEEAIECLRYNLPKDILVHDKYTDPVYWPEWSKLRDKNSIAHDVLFPDDNKYSYLGLCIDMYRLSRINIDEEKIWKKKRAIEFLVRKHDSRVLDDKKYKELFDKWVDEYQGLMTNKISANNTEIFCSVSFPEGYFDLNEIFPLKKYRFEGYDFSGPNNADAILKKFYGCNYMQFPPYDKRILHYDTVKFEVDCE